MRARLTIQDIKELKYSCRYGIIIPLIVLLLGAIILTVVKLNNDTMWLFNYPACLLMLFFICLLFSYLLLRKHLADIKNGEKILEIKKIKQKEYKLDYEAGSGSLGGKMRPIDVWYLIIDNYKYPVERELFNLVSVGDEVYLHIAPLSKELLKIEKKT